MNFSAMVGWLHQNKGAIAERPGWNGTFIAIVPGKVIPPERITPDTLHLIEQYAPAGAIALSLVVPTYFAQWTAPNTLLMGWNASTEDLLAEDWIVSESASKRPIT